MRIVSVPPFVPCAPSVPDAPLPVPPPHAPAPRARDAPTAGTRALLRRTCMPVLLGDADHGDGRLPASPPPATVPMGRVHDGTGPRRNGPDAGRHRAAPATLGEPGRGARNGGGGAA